MRVIDYPEESMLARLCEQTLSCQPGNPKGLRILKEIQLTQEEFDQLREELRGYGYLPFWVSFITVDGKSPFPSQEQAQQQQASRILAPAGAR